LKDSLIQQNENNKPKRTEIFQLNGNQMRETEIVVCSCNAKHRNHESRNQ